MDMILRNSMRYLVGFGLAAFAVLTVVLTVFCQMNTMTFGYVGLALVLLDLAVSFGITVILNRVATE